MQWHPLSEAISTEFKKKKSYAQKFWDHKLIYMKPLPYSSCNLQQDKEFDWRTQTYNLT